VVRVKFKDRRQFESCWLKDISNGGIFLRTQTPAALFGKLQVVLELPNGDTVELQGEVVRVVAPQQAGAGVAAGMGVQFVDLDAEKRSMLESYLGFTQPLAIPDGMNLNAPPPRQPSAQELPTLLPVAGAALPGLPPPEQPRTGAPPAGLPLPPTLKRAPTPSPAGPPPAVIGIEDMMQALRRMLWMCGDSAALADADFYEILGVSPSASGTQVADASAVLRTLIDPQSAPPGVRASSSARFAALRGLLDEIEKTLIDPVRRARYDAGRRPRR